MKNDPAIPMFIIVVLLMALLAIAGGYAEDELQRRPPNTQGLRT